MTTKRMEMSIPMTDIDFEVDVTYSMENDGIGAYEYWGAKCYDRGTDYVDVYSIVPVFDNNVEHKQEIEDYIRDNFDRLCEELAEKLADTEESDNCIDYSDEDYI